VKLSLRPLLLVVCSAVVSFGAGNLPYLHGPLAECLSVGDLNQLVSVSSSTGGHPWLLEANYSIPGRRDNWAVSIYLPADRQTERLRRGRVVKCLSVPPQNAKHGRERRLSGPPGSYAQVSIPDRHFTAQLLDPSGIELPFILEGEFADDDLVSLVDFIRSSPAFVPESARSHDSEKMVPPVRVDGRYPIVAIVRKPDGTFEVGTGSRPGAGQHIAVRRIGSRWVVIEASDYLV